MNVHERLRMLRINSKKTLEEVGSATGLTRQNLHKYENGNISNIPSDKIEALAEYYKVTPMYLMGWEEYDLPSRTVDIPVLGSVPAGTPIEAVADIVGDVKVDYEVSSTGQYFAVKIKDKSMSPEIKDGDIVIVREQDLVESGEIAIVYVNGDDATCKKIVFNKTGIILQPLNPAFDVQVFNWTEADEIPVKIMGRVVEIRRFL